MNITIRMTKVEYEMLKELQKKDKNYKRGLEEKVKFDLGTDHKQMCNCRTS
jgi:hypothetical protein